MVAVELLRGGTGRYAVLVTAGCSDLRYVFRKILPGSVRSCDRSNVRADVWNATFCGWFAEVDRVD